MEIKVGRKYKTRSSGEIVEIIAFDFGAAYPFLGTIDGEYGNSWTSDGLFTLCPVEGHPRDLVEEIVESPGQNKKSDPYPRLETYGDGDFFGQVRKQNY